MLINRNSNQNSIIKGYNLLIYFAGSMIMYEPGHECVKDFMQNGILKALPVSSNNPRFVEAALQLRDSCKKEQACADILVKDYKRLFAGSEKPLAPPVSSYYTGNRGLSGIAGSEDVSDFYNSYGWKYRSRYNYPDNHLGIELLFLTLLNDKYIDMDDEACREEMMSEIRRYIKNHLLSWIPEWKKQVDKYAGTTIYKGIASLIYACSEDIFNLLDNSGPGDDSGTGFRN